MCAGDHPAVCKKKKEAYIYIYTHIGRNKQMCEIKVCARMRDYDKSIYINCFLQTFNARSVNEGKMCADCVQICAKPL